MINNENCFKMWCQKVLPLVYDDSLSYYELLCKVVNYINNLIETQNEINKELSEIKKWILKELENFATDSLNKWLSDGTLESIINVTLMNKKIQVYETTKKMISDSALKNGIIVVTLGYNTINDGGDALFYITDSSTNEPYIEIRELKGVYLPKNKYTLLAFGLEQDNDITEKFKDISEWCAKNNIELNLNLDYKVQLERGLTIPKNLTLTGDKKHKLYGITPYNLTHYNILYLKNSDNAKLKGLIIDGVKQNNQAIDGEWGHCIGLYDSKNVIIDSCELYNAYGDGIELGSTKSGLIDPSFEIKNCYIHDTNRQGISVLSCSNGVIENCNFENIKTKEPKSAIDIEPWFDEQKIENITIRNIKIKECYRGILITNLGNTATKMKTNISIENVSIESEQYGGGVFIGNIDKNIRCNIRINNLNCYNLFHGGLRIFNVNRKCCSIICGNISMLDCGYDYNSIIEAKPLIIGSDKPEFTYQNLIGGVTIENLNISYSNGITQKTNDIVFYSNLRDSSNYSFSDIFIKCNTNKILDWKHVVRSKIITPILEYNSAEPLNISDNMYYSDIVIRNTQPVVLSNVLKSVEFCGLETNIIFLGNTATLNCEYIKPISNEIGNHGMTCEKGNGASLTLFWNSTFWCVKNIVGEWKAK